MNWGNLGSNWLMKWRGSVTRSPRVLGMLAGAGVAGCVAIVVFFGGSRVAEANHGVPLDHFKCYLAQDPTLWNQQVTLADQFTPAAGFMTTVGNAIRFCNPALKVHNGVVTPIGDPNGHLTLYRIGPNLPVIQRQIMVGNQFGQQQQWNLTGPRWLFVPTQKQGHAVGPADLDHFLCYAAMGPNVDVVVVLADEFLVENVNPALPRMFCNPAQKTHNGVVTPIHHPNEHLACYSIQGQPGNRPRFVRNQFGVEQILITNPDMVCLPSSKQVIGGA